ncbi:hypothetical protein [Cyanobacterium sp. Dongsha4]|uniref:hypothetical protein n=1 Tax=Cyanobacterium sp. DS4 TaxID=2878255 RepID=UPI002E80CAAF|nr:hypothetical protein [Cyanobacterium sp. Dongsha4]WVK99374.1 hypothetical protein Dongsha4_11860 [Cyanobacterium sp. Dongsha4]
MAVYTYRGDSTIAITNTGIVTGLTGNFDDTLTGATNTVIGDRTSTNDIDASGLGFTYSMPVNLVPVVPSL